MSSNPTQEEKNRVIELLNSGGKIYLVEDKPYPYPHRTILVLGNERQEISYNTFAMLLTQGALKAKGSTFLDGKSAEMFICSRANDEIPEN